MIGLDTNILAHYYIADQGDEEAAEQRMLARDLMEGGQALMVCKTVVLEFEWVMRGYYGFAAKQIGSVFGHLLSLDHVRIEGREEIRRALELAAIGFDFADALHHASYGDCDLVVSFDDRKFARRAKRAGLMPRVIVPT